MCAQMWACMLCHSEELCPPEKVDAGLNAVLQVAGGVMGRRCLGFLVSRRSANWGLSGFSRKNT